MSSITIDDSGHNLFKDNILAASWIGYTSLLEQLGGILSKGHQLKTFTFSLANEELVPHITTCWNRRNQCGFRDSLRKACDTLRGVRSVGSVTLRGLPEPLSSQLKARMESAPTNFLDLPAEIRNCIYNEALEWPDITKHLARTMELWTDKNVVPVYPTRSMPTVLLLNSQITFEALAMLRKKTLTIVCPREHSLAAQEQVPNLLKFIASGAIKNVGHLVLELHSWEWIYSLDHFLPLFASQTTTMTAPTTPTTSFTPLNGTTNDHHRLLQHNRVTPVQNNTPVLKTIRIHFSDTLKAKFLRSDTQQYPDDTLHTAMSHLAKIRDLQSVTITGDLPECYTSPLAQIMQMPASTQSSALPKLMAIKRNGEMVDADADEDVE